MCSPNPTITWYDKLNQPIKGSPPNTGGKFEIPDSGNGRKLIVKNIDEDDEGVYKCEGFNSKGKDSVAIFLDVYCKL